MPLNEGRPVRTLIVVNTGDRPVQVGSHYHFAAGQPGAGLRSRRGPGTPAGHPGRDRGPVRAGCATRGRAGPAGRGPHRAGPAPGRQLSTERRTWMAELSRSRYAELYGPTTGDRIRLADTDLFIEVTEDLCGGPDRAGDEVVFGGGQGHPRVDGPVPGHPRRRGTRPGDHRRGGPRPLGRHQGRRRHPRRADRGPRQGRQPRHHGRRPPRPGDRPVHRDHGGQREDPDRGRRRLPRAPDLPPAADRGARQRESPPSSAAAPARPRAPRPPPSPRARGTWPGCWRPLDRWPVNVVLLGKGNTVSEEALWEQLRAGASGFKLHEDWGSTPAAIDACLRVCRRGRGPGGAAHRHAERGRLRARTRWPRSPGGRSTPTTPRAPAAVTPPTSSPWPASRTSCRRRPTRPGRTRSTPSTSTSTC